jgi:hypothetical protein
MVKNHLFGFDEFKTIEIVLMLATRSKEAI